MDYFAGLDVSVKEMSVCIICQPQPKAQTEWPLPARKECQYRMLRKNGVTSTFSEID